jgi:hypothetical protein
MPEMESGGRTTTTAVDVLREPCQYCRIPVWLGDLMFCRCRCGLVCAGREACAGRAFRHGKPAHAPGSSDNSAGLCHTSRHELLQRKQFRPQRRQDRLPRTLVRQDAEPGPARRGLKVDGFTAWRKSGRSASMGDCLEAGSCRHGVAVRDTKDRSGPVLTFPPGAWGVFTAALKAAPARPVAAVDWHRQPRLAAGAGGPSVAGECGNEPFLDGPPLLWGATPDPGHWSRAGIQAGRSR